MRWTYGESRSGERRGTSARVAGAAGDVAKAWAIAQSALLLPDRGGPAISACSCSYSSRPTGLRLPSPIPTGIHAGSPGAAAPGPAAPEVGTPDAGLAGTGPGSRAATPSSLIRTPVGR